MSPQLTIVGGGWAGIAAAVHAVQAGARVRLLEMAPQLGGRARSLGSGADALDSGHHILIGAYRQTLDLMRQVGAEPDALLWRGPLALVDAQGRGLNWPAGRSAPLALAQAVARHPDWGRRERLALARWGLGLLLRGLRCPAHWSVARLCADLPAAVRADLFEPLCIAALNTPIEQASAAVFLRVLRDALLGGAGAADLLLPRRPLAQLLPEPAQRWLQARGAQIELGRRVQCLQAGPAGGWWLDGSPSGPLLLACSANEAARLCAGIAPEWSAGAAALQSEAILTVYLQADQVRLPAPMVALRGAPAQFLFDLQAVGGAPGRFAAVGSALADRLQEGRAVLTEAVCAQVAAQLPELGGARLLRSHADRRATFACTAGLQRPPAFIRPGLWACGDYIDGPYPATLEGAVRSGQQAARAALAQCRHE